MHQPDAAPGEYPAGTKTSLGKFIPSPANIDSSLGERPRVIGEVVRQNVEHAINPPVSPCWDKKVVVIGAGAYGTAIASRMADCGCDVLLHGRNEQITHEISLRHTNERYLPGKRLSPKIRADHNPRTACLDRGVIFVSVPTNYWPNILPNFIPHPESLVVILSKGVVVEGWDPKGAADSLRNGPPANSQILLPEQYLKKIPGWQDVANVCTLAGPGFANDIAAGGIINLDVAANSEVVRQRVIDLFLKSGYRDRQIFLNHVDDPFGVAVSAAMKNVVAILAGAVDELRKRYGEELYRPELTQLVKQWGMQERGVIAKHVFGGKYRSGCASSGWPDLNLSTHAEHGKEPSGRNYKLGRKLGANLSVEQIYGSSMEITEGAWSAWALKIATDDRPDCTGIYCPIINAVCDLLGGRRAEDVIDSLLDTEQTRRIATPQRWISGEGIVVN
jgi:glycerol-3-phosphate dehydrogenase (NAD(P)+)